MTCREASEFLHDYVTAGLDAAVSAEFDAHMAECPNCHLFVLQYQSTIAAGRLAFEESDVEASTVLMVGRPRLGFSGKLPLSLSAA